MVSYLSLFADEFLGKPSIRRFVSCNCSLPFHLECFAVQVFFELFQSYQGTRPVDSGPAIASTARMTFFEPYCAASEATIKGLTKFKHLLCALT